MKKIILCVLGLLSVFIYGGAQDFSASSNLEVFPETDRSLYYSVSDSGEYFPIIWGLDLAWLSEANVRRGLAFMGHENVDIMRSSFTPTAPLVEGELPAYELGRLNSRLAIIALLGRPMELVLNCDHPSIDDWYKGNAANWAALIDVTRRLHEEAGHKVVTVSPFNEPDYTATGQGTVGDFFNIAGELRQNTAFDSIRISGANTLNADQALLWYNQLKNRLDEGNTHQLAGSFDNYASFFETVRANGDHATNDELHNVMEAMVGGEYGLQTGIWWGSAEYTRSEFVKASDGRRLAYEEHRDNWTAASVYRHPDGKVQGFVGSSERQAVSTSYRFVSKDKDVFYNGHGPQREYVIDLPGGTGYQQGQSNAEGLVNITWGNDIQPIIDGNYQIVNKHSRLVMEVAGGALSGGANIVQGTPKQAAYQQWSVTPVDLRIGGDFSYFSIINAKSDKSLDILNWSLDNGGNIIQWDDAKGSNQQWYLEYLSDGWFYIRSRYSALCLEVYGNSAANGANIQQSEKDGANNQLWRFIPVDAAVETSQPDAPRGLFAQTHSASVQLQWEANTESDLSAYLVLRADAPEGPYQTIAQGVTNTRFTDNSVLAAQNYYYKVCARDKSLNHSEASQVVSVTTDDSPQLVMHLPFDGTTSDTTLNLLTGVPTSTVVYTEGKKGKYALALNGVDAYVQLPSHLIKTNAFSVSTWVYWKGGASWQRIFDFGNDQSQYVCLTPRLRLAIKDGGAEKRVSASALTKNEWVHLAVSYSDTLIQLFVNGTLVSESNGFGINPVDFKPGINYIGRSQFPTALFNGYIDDFKLYNYALTADEVMADYHDETLSLGRNEKQIDLKLWPVPTKGKVHLSASPTDGATRLTVYGLNGKVLSDVRFEDATSMSLDVSGLMPGVYPVRVSNARGTAFRKVVVRN